MAYKSKTDFNVNRIHEWADILDLPWGEMPGERSEAIDAYNDYYGEHSFSSRMWLNLYEVGYVYCGPEEGGWGITVSTPFACVPVTSREGALRALEILEEAAREEFGDQREYTSAAGGADGTIVLESRRFASEWDGTVPHYE